MVGFGGNMPVRVPMLPGSLLVVPGDGIPEPVPGAPGGGKVPGTCVGVMGSDGTVTG